MSMISIINELANLKQLDREDLLVVLKESLYAAISKRLKHPASLEIVVDQSKNEVYAKVNKEVVENDIYFDEISLEDAQLSKSKVSIGDKLDCIVMVSEFEPKTIKIAKKLIQDRIKELENDRVMFDYNKQKNQVVTGKIRELKFNDYIVDIGYTDAILPADEQISSEYYRVGNIVQAYIVDVRKIRNRVRIVLSRTHPEYIKKLLENEVPEVASGEVEVKKIVRDPGVETKIALYAENPNIDPVSSCYGPKGLRIKEICKNLGDESISLVYWSDSLEQFIANAVGIDFVEKVYLAEHGKFARIITNQKNKAIGKGGINVKLAAKLTGYKIDIFTQEEFQSQLERERRVVSHIDDLDGVTERALEVLKSNGYTSVEDIYRASVEELSNLPGIGLKMIEKLKTSAENF